MKSLPKRPNLEFLKKSAKALHGMHKRADAACCEPIRQHDNGFQNKTDSEILAAKFSLVDAQRVVAREYGYSSWTNLKRYIESLDSPLYHGVSDLDQYHKTITDSYDERSQNYDNSRWHRQIALNTVDFCPPQPGHRVLDIATGTGNIAFYVAEQVGAEGRVVAVDLSTGMLAKCREKLANSRLTNMEFIQADAEHLELELNSFDRIYCSSAFFWMSNPQAALRHWFDLLKPGGHVGFNATPSSSFFWGDGARRSLAKFGITYVCNIPAGDRDDARRLVELAGYVNFRHHQIEDGYYISVEDAKGPPLTLQAYAPGQYPHPLKDVPDHILQAVQRDYEAEIERRATEEGVWHDMTQYYIYGQKP